MIYLYKKRFINMYVKLKLGNNFMYFYLDRFKILFSFWTVKGNMKYCTTCRTLSLFCQGSVQSTYQPTSSRLPFSLWKNLLICFWSIHYCRVLQMRPLYICHTSTKNKFDDKPHKADNPFTSLSLVTPPPSWTEAMFYHVMISVFTPTD